MDTNKLFELAVIVMTPELQRLSKAGETNVDAKMTATLELCVNRLRAAWERVVEAKGR